MRLGIKGGVCDKDLFKKAAAGFFFFLLVAGLAACAGRQATMQPQPLLYAQQVPQPVMLQEIEVVGPMHGDRQMKLAISLPMRDQDKLRQLMKDLYDPASPKYRHYLSSKEFTDQFGPSKQDYEAVVAWATASGFSVTRTMESRQVVDVVGTVDTINRALHVRMMSYQHPRENRVFHAPDRQPTLDLSVPVYSISGLDDYYLPRSMLIRNPMRQRNSPTQIGSGPGGTYTPGDIRKAYYGDGPLTGKGQTVAVFSFCDYKDSDLQLFYVYAYPAGQTLPKVPVERVKVNNPSFSTCHDDDGEQVIDIGNVIGMAPGLSKVLFYEGDYAIDILAQIAQDNTAKVISSSWGGKDFADVSFDVWAQLAVQGQTFVQASGDGGAYPGNIPHCGFGWLPPILNPVVLNVGGTSLTTHGTGGAWKSETAWNCGGGGYLDVGNGGFEIPDYQLQGVANALNAGSRRWRNGPDVAAQGDENNFMIDDGKLYVGIAGTSYSAPRWAGILALVNEAAQNAGQPSIGFVNPALYSLGLGPDYQTAFHDITEGDNFGFKAVERYDLATGWGSPKVPALIDLLTAPPANSSAGAP